MRAHYLLLLVVVVLLGLSLSFAVEAVPLSEDKERSADVRERDPTGALTRPEDEQDNDLHARSARDSTKPQSGQKVRLRGGPSPLEGYVEVMGPGSSWGVVCDRPEHWTVAEANVVCHMLGYERGAELAWQGRPGGSPSPRHVHVEKVGCSGNESSLMECVINFGDACDLETQAAAVRCFPNKAANCRPGETPFKGACYSVVLPKDNREVDLGTAQEAAIRQCLKQDAHLIDINSQAEGDFVSEWLRFAYPDLSTVLTCGYGALVPSAPGGPPDMKAWVWQESAAMEYNLFWPGPPALTVPDSATAPQLSKKPVCVLLKKTFPSGVVDYFFWQTEDCAAVRPPLPFICERPADGVRR